MTTLTIIAAIVAACSFALHANRPFFCSLAVIAGLLCAMWLP